MGKSITEVLAVIITIVVSKSNYFPISLQIEVLFMLLVAIQLPDGGVSGLVVTSATFVMLASVAEAA